jgi:NTE family protein
MRMLAPDGRPDLRYFLGRTAKPVERRHQRGVQGRRDSDRRGRNGCGRPADASVRRSRFRLTTTARPRRGTCVQTIVGTPSLSIRKKRKASQMPKVVNLALRGGGSHGAFTWGVLDRLLEEERLSFEGISATSAGAVNAVVLADGLAAGGREGAREALRVYWQKVSALSTRGIFKPSPLDKGNSDFGLEHSLGFWFLKMTYLTSPYQMNPFNHNPLKDLLAEAINFERVRGQTNLKLFLCATDVQTAKVKIFAGKELRVEHLLASTCLPLLMQSVEIDGEYYWDGSYAANPAIYPLVYECDSRDILIVHITPAERSGVPTTSPAIMNRMQEISFNTSLIREMRMIASYNKLIEQGRMRGGKLMLLHLIEAEDFIRAFSWTSRLNADWDFLQHLHKMGRTRADQWLEANFDRLGIESTVDLDTKYF